MAEVADYVRAMNYVCAYCAYKRDAESLSIRPQWFTGFPRFYVFEGTEPPAELVDLIVLMSHDQADQDAYEAHRRLADRKIDANSTSDAERSARVRLLVMSSLQQAVRRQFFGADANPRTSLDCHRYEYLRKVPAGAMLASLRDRFSEESPT